MLTVILNKASSNAQDGVSLIQVAEGALGETHSILQRMNELATQSANDTNTTADRQAIQAEINQLASEISRISSTTQFNTMNLSSLSKNVVLAVLNHLFSHISVTKTRLCGLSILGNVIQVSDGVLKSNGH